MFGLARLLLGITSPKTSEKCPKPAENCPKLAENGSKSREFSFEWLSFLMQALGGQGVKITSTRGGNQPFQPQGLTPNNFTSFRLSIHKCLKQKKLQRRSHLKKITARWQLFNKV